MNTNLNALSAKNVKIHGMSSAKWTTKDKITQYKGLVNLYLRDQQITRVDTAVAEIKQSKGLNTLRKTIDANRKKLDNAIKGDRQQLRNTFAEHKEMQLAYQNSDPKKVIENVHQVNFTKRKVLDKLKYQMKLKSQELIDLKLEEALLQDRLKYGSSEQLKHEQVAQIITGKVQDALLKKEAALAIQQTYVQIIDVMRKDALYFDSILLTIQNDYWYQCRCVLNAAKQGQLATEYKNDREQEFADLEKAILQDMKTQKLNLQVVREQTENLQSNLKHLLRRDSDVTTCIIKVQETHDFAVLHKDLKTIENALEFLKTTTLVPTYEQIFPSLQEQRRQRKRLRKLAKRCQRDRDIIMNKLNHAELMSNLLKNTMVETTGQYKRRKKELKNLIAEESEKKKIYDKEIDYKYNLIAKVGISLRQLMEICETIRTPEERRRRNSMPIEDPVPEPPSEHDTDGMKIIAFLTQKLTYLMSNVREKFDDSKIDTAYKFYEILMNERRIEPQTETITDQSLLEGLITEVSHLLTRQDIKRQSREIVLANRKEDDFIPEPAVKKKKISNNVT